MLKYLRKFKAGKYIEKQVYHNQTGESQYKKPIHTQKKHDIKENNK